MSLNDYTLTLLCLSIINNFLGTNRPTAGAGMKGLRLFLYFIFYDREWK